MVNDVSAVEVTCMHTMPLIGMHSRKDGNRVLNMHALPKEMCMCVHAWMYSYTSTFGQFSFGLKIRRSMCIHEGGVLFVAKSQEGVLVEYYFGWVRPPESDRSKKILGDCISYFCYTRPPKLQVHVYRFLWWRLLSLKTLGWGPPTDFTRRHISNEKENPSVV